MRFFSIFAGALLTIVSAQAWGHGLTSTSARVEARPGNLIELQVQFDFIGLLNHESHAYSLPVIAALPEDKFGLFYQEVIKLFDRELSVRLGDKAVFLNKRYPSEGRVFELIRRQFAESRFEGQAVPYTFSDRRFYQQFYVDFRLPSAEALSDLEIDFPDELGQIYLTFSRPVSEEVKKGRSWRPGG